MKRKSGIYKIQFTTKDNIYVYIGKTIDIDRRKKEHFTELNNNNHHNSFMQRVYNKYGKDSMKFSVVLYCEESELNSKEILYIDKYKNEDNIICMNMTNGGDGGNTYQYLSKEKLSEIKEKQNKWNKEHPRTISEERKKIISLANSHPKSDEAKKHMSESWTRDRRNKLSEKVSGKNNPMYGVHRFGELHPLYGKTGESSPRYGMFHSKESKLKMSETRKTMYKGKDNPMYGKTHSYYARKSISDKNSKKIFILDNKYNIIKEYKNKISCDKENGDKKATLYYNKNVLNLKDIKFDKNTNFSFIFETDYNRIKGGDN